jgi:hypothetical protein
VRVSRQESDVAADQNVKEAVERALRVGKAAGQQTVFEQDPVQGSSGLGTAEPPHSRVFIAGRSG